MNFNIEKYRQLHSTNAKAMELVAKGVAKEGGVVVAEEQTYGKGTGNSRWESEQDKNLTFSLILSPKHIRAQQQFLLTQIVSLSLHKCLSKELSKEKIRIKWPNDIYVGDKKIAGILIQNLIKASEISHCIIGIGLNVNQEKFISDAPNPISMICIKKTETDLNLLLHKVLVEIGRQYELSKNSDESQRINHEYRKLLYRFREWAMYQSKTEKFAAKIIGISQYGQLLLLDKKNRERIFNFKEVEFII